MNRRTFVGTLLGGGAAAYLAAVLYPLARFLVPPRLAEATTNSVVAAKVGELRPNTGKIFAFGRQPALLVLTPQGEYRAFSAVCTHLQCTVQYRGDLQQIWCACHNGHYDLSGNVVSGPPPRPLSPYQVVVRGEEILVVRES